MQQAPAAITERAGRVDAANIVAGAAPREGRPAAPRPGMQWLGVPGSKQGIAARLTITSGACFRKQRCLKDRRHPMRSHKIDDEATVEER